VPEECTMERDSAWNKSVFGWYFGVVKGETEGKRWNDVGFDKPERDIGAYRKSAEAVHVVVIILRLSPSVQGFLLPALTTLLTQSF